MNIGRDHGKSAHQGGQQRTGEIERNDWARNKSST
jgi:hypothetical protein